MRELEAIAPVAPIHLWSLELPLYGGVGASFPSPANDYLEEKLDLNRYLIHNPSATFFVRVVGDSMIEAGIFAGDLAIVDRSLTAQSNDVIIAVVNGEFTLKRLIFRKKRISLMPENNNYAPLEINAADDFRVWGVVVHVIHKVSR